MYDTRFAVPGDLSAVLALLVRLQADSAHHIGYLGETLGELTEELAEFEPDWPSCTVVATDDSGRVCGVLSVEIDQELKRSWLHGPFVDVPVNHPAGSRIWDQTADALYKTASRFPTSSRPRSTWEMSTSASRHPPHRSRWRRSPGPLC
jgi:hypothetical protein